MVKQPYGVPQGPRKLAAIPSPPYAAQHSPSQLAYPSALQYQAISPMYSYLNEHQSSHYRQYPYQNPDAGPPRSFVKTVPKYYPYDEPAAYSLSNKVGGPSQGPSMYSNGDVLQQMHFSVGFRHYNDPSEQGVPHYQQPVDNWGLPTVKTGIEIPVMASEMDQVHSKQDFKPT